MSDVHIANPNAVRSYGKVKAIENRMTIHVVALASHFVCHLKSRY
ncbi:hypothetical protein SNOG_02580 [Parastagonospora nodorum SN15]|uniref:Uncharacterized protein n=1 Tax=Phaeosphaeria nodorum (strain SN15 / ATCC MYA-4574 / FGSC 10173) TaxID=321614 RepID=Q0V084_PHANO|nr:hypothetical protein SNOG_02580 [Parastagonospora nodorum SN15]EAT89311.1 hypothetical protein SNOG_02580 [Parastagonospora nodorum SN15]